MSWGGGWLSIKVQARREMSSTEGEKEGGGEERGTEGGESIWTNVLKPDKFGRDHRAYPTTAPHERHGSWAMAFTQQTQEMRFCFIFIFFFLNSINSPDPTETKNEKEGGGKTNGTIQQRGTKKEILAANAKLRQRSKHYILCCFLNSLPRPLMEDVVRSGKGERGNSWGPSKRTGQREY